MGRGDVWKGREIRDLRTRSRSGRAFFNVVGGLWPLVHLRSFEWVFGPKTDVWLQQTTGGLLVSVGLDQLVAAKTLGHVQLELLVLTEAGGVQLREHRLRFGPGVYPGEHMVRDPEISF